MTESQLSETRFFYKNKCFSKPVTDISEFYKINLIPVHSGPFRSIPVHSGLIPVHSGLFRFIPVHSVPFRSIPVHSGLIPVHSVPFRSIPVSFRSIPVSFRSIPVHSGSFRFIPVHSGHSVPFRCLVTPDVAPAYLSFYGVTTHRIISSTDITLGEYLVVHSLC